MVLMVLFDENGVQYNESHLPNYEGEEGEYLPL